MPHPAYILLRWIESFLCYLVQFGTGALLIALCLMSTDAAVAAIQAEPLRLAGIIDFADWLAAGLTGAVFLTYGLFDRLLAGLRQGPGRLALDLVMAAVLVRGAVFAFQLIQGPASPFSGRLDHPFFLVLTVGWLLIFFAAFLFPALAHRRSEPLPDLHTSWAAYVAKRDIRYARIAVVGSLLLGPLVLVLPSLRLLP